MTLIHRIVPLTLSLCSLLVSAAEMTQENSTARGSLVDSALEQRVTWPSAAEMDWVRYDTAEPSESNGTLMCEGRYVEPIATSSEWQSDPVNVENVRITAHQSSGQIDKQWIFEGTVTLIDHAHSIESPMLELDQASQMASLSGPISMRDPGMLVVGEKAITNLDTGESSITQASFLLHEPGIRGSAEQLTRTGEKHLIIEKGAFTRCEPGSNAWMFTGGRMTLKPETGFGSARNVVLRIKGIPVGYIPYIKFPIDDERHSGILIPTLSWDNEAATDFSLPVYFNLAPSVDATWTPRSLWRRGISHGLQLRFLTRQSSNEINGAYLGEDKLYTETLQVDRTSGGIVNISPVSRKDRWFVNLRHSGGAQSRLKSRLSYNAVSDPDYIDDIGGDFGSSAVSRYMDSMESALSSRRTPMLERIGELDYRGDTWNLLVRAQGFQNLEPDAREEYERLPQVRFNHQHQGSWVNIHTLLDMTRFEKNNENLTGSAMMLGDRAVADLRLSLPLRSSWGFFKPEINVNHRSYRLEDLPAGYQAEVQHTLAGASLDMGLYFDRPVNRGQKHLVQSFEPRLFYLYVPEKDQSLLPLFDARPLTDTYQQMFRRNRFSGWDRIGDTRQVSLGITNRLTRKNTGAELIRFDLGQIWYFKDRIVNLPPTLPGKDPAARRSPVFALLKMTPNDKWQLSGNLQWEPANGTTNQGGISIKYISELKRILNISYRYTNSDVVRLGNFDSIEESDINFIWPLKGQWGVIGKWNYGWDRKQTIESFFGLEYNDCCWRTRLVVRRFLKTPQLITLLVDDPGLPGGYQSIPYLDERADTGIFFEFQLKGLGTLGGRLGNLLEEAIPGYQKRENQLSQ